MDAGGSHGGQKSDINVTPLIDIVLVLLIVFIIMVPGLSKALPVVVPQVVIKQEPQTPTKDVPLVLECLPKPDKTYAILLQSKEIQLSEIMDQLAPAVQMQPLNMRKIFIKIDEDVPYQMCVSMLDQVRRASERAKKETKAKPEMAGIDGGDIKAACSIRKRPTA